jgi:hypothetical protein
MGVREFNVDEIDIKMLLPIMNMIQQINHELKAKLN